MDGRTLVSQRARLFLSPSDLLAYLKCKVSESSGTWIFYGADDAHGLLLQPSVARRPSSQKAASEAARRFDVLTTRVELSVCVRAYLLGYLVGWLVLHQLPQVI